MGIVERLDQKWRRKDLMKFAAASGLVYTEDGAFPGSVLWGVCPTDVPFPDGPAGPGSMPPLSKNMLSGRWQGLPVGEADFSILDMRPETWPLSAGLAPMLDLTIPKIVNARFSAVIADLPATLPDLMIQRKMPGFGGRPTFPHHIESGSRDFDRTFQVTPANTAFAAKVIDASMITWLLYESNRVFMLKLKGRNLLVVLQTLRGGYQIAAIALLWMAVRQTGQVTERLRVREIGDDEGQPAGADHAPGTGSVVTWRRAQMVQAPGWRLGDQHPQQKCPTGPA